MLLLLVISCLHLFLLVISKLLSPCILYTSPTMVSNNCEVNKIAEEAMSILDLPELTLECILGKLAPAGLSRMTGVCRSLRERCRSDHLWERHMRAKWGRVVVGSAAAQDKWRRYLASGQDSGGGRPRVWVESLTCFWPFSWVKSQLYGGGVVGRRMLDDSIMSRFVELERGRFWFPAQVYNRENGHVGFVLSCYDAELRYDRHTDTFQARYPPHGRRTIVTEMGLSWDRLRAPPVITSALDLHLSDCLTDLCPGDHIEIQWRRNKEFPYGWWYGMVGHLESCDGNEHFCRCSTNGTSVSRRRHHAAPLLHKPEPRGRRRLRATSSPTPRHRSVNASFPVPPTAEDHLDSLDGNPRSPRREDRSPLPLASPPRLPESRLQHLTGALPNANPVTSAPRRLIHSTSMRTNHSTDASSRRYHLDCPVRHRLRSTLPSTAPSTSACCSVHYPARRQLRLPHQVLDIDAVLRRPVTPVPRRPRPCRLRRCESQARRPVRFPDVPRYSKPAPPAAPGLVSSEASTAINPRPSSSDLRGRQRRRKAEPH